jgi:hypothetical protein
VVEEELANWKSSLIRIVAGLLAVLLVVLLVAAAAVMALPACRKQWCGRWCR